MLNQPTIRILLLEDDPADREILAYKLRNQRSQFELEWVESMVDAIKTLAEQTFDAIITDLSVTDSQGLATVSRLKEYCGQAPIIVLTGLVDESVEKQILSAGAQDYLVKGEFGKRDIERAVLHAVLRQQAMNQVNSLVAELKQSQQLQHEQALQLVEKNQRLTQLYKTTQEFVDNVSHDFRTPLTVIKDYVAIIREGMVGDINPQQQSMLDKVGVRADDLNNMVDDLLDASKLESGLLNVLRRRVSVPQMIDRASSMLRQRAEVRGVLLHVDLPDELPDVYCDSDKVCRIISNLAVNAIKFAGDPGRVRLWADHDPLQQHVVIGVSDNGAGIEPAELEKIFERFRQLDGDVKTASKGFGLGLNIARQLCRLNFGEIGVESEPGQGSTFSFTIPLHDPAEVLRRSIGDDRQRKEKSVAMSIQPVEDVSESEANELDNFLNCLLRGDDLLFRVDTDRWLLIANSHQHEEHCWYDRAMKELAKTNRNRPLGPLPEFKPNVLCHWTCKDTVESVLADFEDATRWLLRREVVPC